MATDRGADVVRRDGKAFARFQWESWSPHGWFDDAVFNAVAESLKNPDWPNMTLHSYRVRWGEAEPDPYYAAARLAVFGCVDCIATSSRAASLH
jgi:hypothetical protein